MTNEENKKNNVVSCLLAPLLSKKRTIVATEYISKRKMENNIKFSILLDWKEVYSVTVNRIAYYKTLSRMQEEASNLKRDHPDNDVRTLIEFK